MARIDMMPDQPENLRVQLVEEELSIGKREVETDRLRVRTIVDTLDTPVQAMLSIGQLDVSRVAVDREVAEAPAPYQEGDTLVIPIVEERLVVEKRLFVVEELRVTHSSREEAFSTSVPLRRTRAVVERTDPNPLTTGDH